MCNKCDAGVLADEYHVVFQNNNDDIVRLCSQYIPALQCYTITPQICSVHAKTTV